MITGVDHVAIIVRDLEKSLADFSLLLGRSPSWRGTLEGASHAWFQLPNTAIDVISPAKDGRFGGRAKDRLADKAREFGRLDCVCPISSNPGGCSNGVVSPSRSQ